MGFKKMRGILLSFREAAARVKQFDINIRSQQSQTKILEEGVEEIKELSSRLFKHIVKKEGLKLREKVPGESDHEEESSEDEFEE